MSTSEHSISVRGLRKSFHDLDVLQGINLDVAPGELTVLIGPSGCGKSTLLRCLNGLESFDSGKISVNGIDLEKKGADAHHEREFHQKYKQIRQQVGMVFQSYNLFPHLNLLDNVTKAPMVVKGVERQEAEALAYSLLQKVGLSKYTHHYPLQLSGGQQQRGAIARALAMSPKAMLYDEPTSSLDPSLVDEVLQVMRRLDDEGMTQIVVTHEMRFAKEVGDQIVFMEGGVIAETGSPEQIFTNPQNDGTRHFLRKFL